MQRDARTYLWDARRAATLVGSFVSGHSWEDYQADQMLRSAVERQFEIVGEALNRLRQVDAALASEIPDLVRIIGFRNALIHGYSMIDDQVVWDTANELVDPLIAILSGMLGEY